MNFLFVNHHASAPKFGNPYRTYYIAKELALLGHEVYIIASSFSHLRQSQPKIDDKMVVEKIDGINFIWIKSTSYSYSYLSRIKNIFSFLVNYYLLKDVILDIIKPDIVYEGSTHLLPFFISRMISKKSSAKLIFEVRDLWPLSLVEVAGFSKLNPFILGLSFFQKKCIKQSDLLISNLKYAKEYFENEESTVIEKFLYLPNGITPDLYHQTKNNLSNEFNDILLLKEKYNMILGYSGSMGRANSVDKLIEVAKTLLDYNIGIVLIGDGERKKYLISKCKKDSIYNVHFFNSLPKDKIYKVISTFDLGFVGGRSRNIHKFGVSPNKLYDYMISKIPVLFALDTDDNIIRDAACGVYLEDFSKEGLVNAILYFNKLDVPQRNEMGANGLEFVYSNNDYKFLVSNLIKKINSL